MKFFIMINFFNKILVSNLIILINLFIINNSSATENKIIFKINNKAFTTIDYQLRIEYLDFVGGNQNLTEETVINDFISANLFNEHFKASKKINDKEYEKKIEEIFINIYDTNQKNKKNYKYVINKKNILDNLKIDYYRKLILEEALNTNINNLSNSSKDVDLLYNIELSYINLNYDNTEEIKEKIINLNNINIDNVKNYLNENNINFFFKQKEVINIEKLDPRIRKNILSNNNFFIFENNNKISFIFVKKKFETFESILVNLFSVRSDTFLDNEILKCKNLKSNNEINVFNKEYKYEDLNNKLKNKLININDYLVFNENNQKIYIVLCDIKFDKDILQNYNFNKLINFNVSNIEKKLINKYAKIYNLIKN